MKKKVVLIFEARINYHALDLAIAACKSNEANLDVIFIAPVKDEKTGYGFPSDISLAETITDEKDIWQEDTELMLQEAKLIHQKAGAENITATTGACKKLSAAALQKIVDEAMEVYVDATMDKPVTREGADFSIDDMHATAACPVVLVKEK